MTNRARAVWHPCSHELMAPGAFLIFFHRGVAPQAGLLCSDSMKGPLIADTAAFGITIWSVAIDAFFNRLVVAGIREDSTPGFMILMIERNLFHSYRWHDPGLKRHFLNPLRRNLVSRFRTRSIMSFWPRRSLGIFTILSGLSCLCSP